MALTTLLVNRKHFALGRVSTHGVRDMIRRCEAVVLGISLLVIGLSGCTLQQNGGGVPGLGGDGEQCPSEALHTSAFSESRDYINWTGPERVVTNQLEGKQSGDIWDATLSLDISNKTYLLQGDQGDFAQDTRAKGQFWSRHNQPDDGEEFKGYGRDFNPEGAADTMLKQLISGTENATNSGPQFLNDLGADDFNATCTTRDGRDAIKYTYEDSEGREAVAYVEENPPHRFLYELEKDPALDHNLRRTYSYKPIPVSVDKSHPKAPPSIYYKELESRQTDDGGSLLKGQVVERTQWAKFSDTEAVVHNGYSIIDRAQLRSGTIQLDGGTLTYEDNDNNQMISPGDVFTWDVDSGLNGGFFDQWSQKVAGLFKA